MAIEVANYIAQLDEANPPAGDPFNEGDDQIRLTKKAVRQSFPNVAGVVSATDVQLSYVTGVTSAIQTQINAKAPIASPAFTGTPAAPTATPGASTTQIATTAFVTGGIATALAANTAAFAAAIAQAQAAADTAMTFAGAARWVSGTTYALGAVVWSPTNQQIYRRIVAGAGTTDPSADGTNWVAVLSTSPTAESLFYNDL